VHRVLVALCVLGLAALPAAAAAEAGGFESLRQTSKAFAEVARQVAPAVVFVQVESRRESAAGAPWPFPFGPGSPFGEEFFERFFGEQWPPRQRERPAIGAGSGFVFETGEGVLGDKAYILTNNHVVQNAERIIVRFQDGRELEAGITGADPASDVAVIEVDTGGLQALPLGDSTGLQVGEWVLAMGNPFGLSHTLTVGVVSAKGRTSIGITDYEDFIQTDAAINPGNSGGPLVNLDGEVVGINTAIFSRSGGYMGVGFAIPINLAKAVAEQLIEDGEVTRGYLGVVIQPLTEDLAASLGIEQREAILIAEVSPDSPAAAAGLQVGDVIVAYRGEPVRDVGRFRNQVALTEPGSRAVLTVMRDGERLELAVTIGTLEEERLLGRAGAGVDDKLGLTVQALTPELARRFDAEPGEGVIVTAVAPDSLAARAGIAPGTVILEVNRQPVGDVAEFRRAVAAGSEDRRVLLLVRSGGMQRFVVLDW